MAKKDEKAEKKDETKKDTKADKGKKDKGDKKLQKMPDKFVYGPNDHLTIWDADGNLVHKGGKPVPIKKDKDQSKKTAAEIRDEILRMAADQGIKKD
jgi:hypothetical protein